MASPTGTLTISSSNETRRPEDRPGSAAPFPNSSTTATTPTPAASQARDAKHHRTTVETSSRTFLNRADKTGPNGPGYSYATWDGRIRNPVPLKLQGRASKRDGNFSIVSMDLTTPGIPDRVAAAKRTSEGTEAAARLATKDGYQSIKRRELRFLPPEAPKWPAEPPSQSSNTPDKPLGPPAPSTSPPIPPRSNNDPDPRGTKIEQARLLTSLRSLHPTLIVDQLCKALAYFGGTPDAPPPADGIFPRSAGSNGSGALLVNWMAEIFPPADAPARAGRISPPPAHLAVAGATVSDTGPVPDAVAGSHDPQVPPTKRPRGRPKGSKSSKVRKDKGLKKAERASAADTSVPAESSQPAPAEATRLVRELGNQMSQQSAAAAEADVAQATPTSADGPAESRPRPEPDSSAISTPGSKKRGRPKGSKNRPRNPSEPDSSGPPLVSQHSNPSTGGSLLSQRSTTDQAARQGLSTPSHTISATLMPSRGPIQAHPTPARTPAGLGLGAARGVNNLAESGATLPQVLPSSHPAQTMSSRKRKTLPPDLAGGQVPPVQTGGLIHAQTAAAIQASARDAQAKRRRVSNGAQQHPTMSGGDSRSSSAVGVSASPTPRANQPPGSATSASASSSFGSQGSMSRQPNIRTAPNQRVQQQHHGSPNTNMTPQQQPQLGNPSPAASMPRPRPQLPAPYGAQQQASRAHAPQQHHHPPVSNPQLPPTMRRQVSAEGAPRGRPGAVHQHQHHQSHHHAREAAAAASSPLPPPPTPSGRGSLSGHGGQAGSPYGRGMHDPSDAAAAAAFGYSVAGRRANPS